MFWAVFGFDPARATRVGCATYYWAKFMFGTIRKHQNWLWAIIITLTIISFVVFFSPYSKMHDATTGNYGSIGGKKVTQEDYLKAQREVYLRYFFMTGRWPDQDAQRRGFDSMRETYQWMLLTRRQDDLGIIVSEDVAARTGREMLQGFERQGITSPSIFAQQVLQPQGLSLRDFERFVKHFVGLQQVMTVAGASGKLVTPQEARELYIRENQPVSAEAVLFSASNHLSQVKITPDAITTFYSNSLANYRIPERIQIGYVKFPVSNFMAQAEAELSRSNLNEMVEANVQRLGTNLFGGAKTIDESKAKIKAEIVRARAMAEARRKANDFARPIFEAEKLAIGDLEQAASAQNLKMVITPPFDRENGPEGMEVGEDFLKAAFSRTPEDPFGQPYLGMDGTYVYGLHKRINSEIPPLDQIRGRVENDYTMMQAAEMARGAGRAFYSTLTNGFAQGKSFTELAKSANLKIIAIPQLAQTTRNLSSDIEDHVSLNLVKQLALEAEPGKPTGFQATGDGGIILFVKERLPIDEKKMNEEMPMFLSYVRRARSEEAFQAWFRKEAEKGLLDTPLAQEVTGRPGKS